MRAGARPARPVAQCWGRVLTCRGCGQPSWVWVWGGSDSPCPGCWLAWPAPLSSQAGEPSASRALQTEPLGHQACATPWPPDAHPGQAGLRCPGSSWGLTCRRSPSPAGPPAASAPRQRGTRRTARARARALGTLGHSAAPPRSLGGLSARHPPGLRAAPPLCPGRTSTHPSLVHPAPLPGTTGAPSVVSDRGRPAHPHPPRAAPPAPPGPPSASPPAPPVRISPPAPDPR